MSRDPLARLVEATNRRALADAVWRQAMRDARAAGYTLRAIADAAGVSYQTVANVLATDD